MGNRKPKNQSKVTIHNVHILDASGSMKGQKYDNALKGINDELRILKRNKKVNYTQTVIEFDSVDYGKERITTHYFVTPINSASEVTGVGARGNTPLYQAVGNTLEDLVRKVKSGDTVLVKIFTDGYHNCFWGKYNNKHTLNELVSDLQENHNFTINFVGTQEDVEKAVYDLGLNVGNTFTYDGTATGTASAFVNMVNSTVTFADAVEKGLKKSRSFFVNKPEIKE